MLCGWKKIQFECELGNFSQNFLVIKLTIEYVGILSQTAGIKVAIHNPFQVPFPENYVSLLIFQQINHHFSDNDTSG